MKRASFLAAMMLFAECVVATTGIGTQPRNYVPNELIVKFGQEAGAKVTEQIASGTPVSQMRISAPLDKINSGYRIGRIQPLCRHFKQHRERLEALREKDTRLLTEKQQRILRRLSRAPKDAQVPDLSRVYKITLDLQPGQCLQEAVLAYNSDPRVEYAELNYLVSIHTEPNDPLYPIQWPLNNTGQTYPESGRFNPPPGTPDCDIDAPEAWSLATGGAQTIVAVVDTGLDYAHRDLQGNIWTNSEEVPGNGLDDDENGYIDDTYGYDFFNDDPDPKDDHGHGTHCAGVIAARTDNGLDMTGVCRHARIMGLKFLGSAGGGYVDGAVGAIYYAVENGADVISCSWGGQGDYNPVYEAIEYAYSMGVIVVASAGNSDSNIPPYPGGYNHVIGVAATNSNDEKASFSNYGDWVDIAAPGVDILSLRASGTSMGTVYDDYTTIASGTSMSCPHLAAACGFLLSSNPLLKYDQVYKILVHTVDPISPGVCLSGRLNLHNAARTTRGVSLTRDYYGCSDELDVYLVDSNLAGQASVQAMLAASGGDLETIVLTEASPPSGFFTGTISTASGGPFIEDGALQVSHAESITATFENYNDTASVDCMPPLISNLQFDQYPIGCRPTVSFETDEPTTARVLYGGNCGGPSEMMIATDPALATTHTIQLTEVSPETLYFFLLETTDTVGNVTVDDNAGQCHTFTTDGPNNTIYVPSQIPTIQQAVNNCWDGGTVVLAEGTYSGPGNRDIDFLGKSITVRSTQPHDPDVVSSTIIDCNGTSTEPHRGFYFHRGESPNTVLDGLTVTHGLDYYGAGIYCLQSSPTIRNCVISKNSANHTGGGLCFSASNSLVNKCTITSNYAQYGGGISCTDSHLVAQSCAISGNSSFAGGGIMSNGNSNTTILNCAVTDNRAQSWGAGVDCLEGSLTLVNSTIVGNTAVTNGAGVHSAELAITDLTNCIVWENSATQISGAANVTFCDVEGGYDGQGNISIDPCFVDGTHSNYHLMCESPCIDAGTNWPASGLPEADIEGSRRPQDGDGDTWAVADVGAYERCVCGGPLIELSTTEVKFFAPYGQAPLDDNIISIRNRCQGTLAWTITDSCPWLQASPPNGESSGEPDDVILSVDAVGLPVGSYSCALTIIAPGAANSPRTVDITLIVSRLLRAPADYPTIQDAIDAAENGDTVLIADGTYTGPGNHDVDFHGKAITVRSENGPDNCIIDCQGTATQLHRAFHFKTGETFSSVLAGLTITGGCAVEGGAVKCQAGSPTIRDCVFRGNASLTAGGAILNEYSSPVISGCLFQANNARWFGGALANYDGTDASVTNCLFALNTADYGGAVESEISGGTIINCTFSRNSADYGGAIEVYGDPKPTVVNSILWANTAPEGPQIWGSCPVLYSDVQGSWPGLGNINADPIFAAAENGDYHLNSTSPAVDKGDPGFDCSNEPWPNGYRINMGAYGNTPEAAVSPTTLDDLTELASVWLGFDRYIDAAPKPDGDRIVNFLDFSVLALQWAGQ